jgi:hypothetical protein
MWIAALKDPDHGLASPSPVKKLLIARSSDNINFG